MSEDKICLEGMDLKEVVKEVVREELKPEIQKMKSSQTQYLQEGNQILNE